MESYGSELVHFRAYSYFKFKILILKSELLCNKAWLISNCWELQMTN